MILSRLASVLRVASVPVLACGAFLSAGPARAVDPLVEVLFWDSAADTVSVGVNSYFKLQRERALWANETARLTAELEACQGCDRARLEQELAGWKETERDYQNIVGTVLSQGGYGATVQRFFGITNPQGGGVGLQATGQRDIIDYDALPDPVWLAGAGEYCQAVYPQMLQCNKQLQEQGFRPAGACKEVNRLNSFCAAGDETGAMDYSNVLNLRLAGAIIPEVTDDGVFMTADYGRVAPHVGPRVSGGAEMARYFEQTPQREGVIHKLDRGNQAGLLERAAYTRFFARDFNDFNRACSSVAGQASPPACGRLTRLRHDRSGTGYNAPVVLRCDYSTPGQPGVNRLSFWLNSIPREAQMARGVSAEISQMKAAGFCPVSFTDARLLAEARLTDQQMNRIDYTVPMPDGSRDGVITPDGVIDAIRGYGAEVTETGFIIDQSSGGNTQGGSPVVMEPLSLDAAMLGLEPAPDGEEVMDLLGLRIGMTRVEVTTLMTEEMPEPVAVMTRSVAQSNTKPLFRFTTHYREDTGRDVVVFFDADGDAASVIGVLVQVPAHSQTVANFPDVMKAANEKFRPWITDRAGGDKTLLTGDIDSWNTCIPRINQQKPSRMYQDAKVTFDVKADGVQAPVIAEFVDTFSKSRASKVEGCGAAFALKRSATVTSAAFTDMSLAYQAYAAAMSQ